MVTLKPATQKGFLDAWNAGHRQWSKIIPVLPDDTTREDLWINRKQWVETAMTSMEKFFVNTFRRRIMIYPTGSNNFTSDIDVQFSLNLCDAWDAKQIQEIARLISQVREQGASVWSVALGVGVNLNEVLDVNFYPPTIFNYAANEKCISDNLKENLLLLPHNYSQRVIAVWRPCFEQMEFLVDDLIQTAFALDTTRVDTYYVKYEKEIAKNLQDLLNAAKDGTLGCENKNELVKMLTHYNPIGPEMYYSVCNIIFVVFCLQMGGDLLSCEDLMRCACVAAIENYFHYITNKKEKYAQRCCTAMRFADENLCVELLGAASKKIQENAVSYPAEFMRFEEAFVELQRARGKLFAQMQESCKKWVQGEGQYVPIITNKNGRCLRKSS